MYEIECIHEILACAPHRLDFDNTMVQCMHYWFCCCTELFYDVIPTLFLCFLLICYPYIVIIFVLAIAPCSAEVRKFQPYSHLQSEESYMFCTPWKESHAFHDGQERIGTFFLAVESHQMMDWQSFNKHFECIESGSARLSQAKSVTCVCTWLCMRNVNEIVSFAQHNHVDDPVCEIEGNLLPASGTAKSLGYLWNHDLSAKSSIENNHS